MCTQRRCELWSSFLPSPEFEANSPNVQVSEDPENGFIKLCAERNLESAAEVVNDDVHHKDGDENKWWQEVKIPRGKVAQVVRELDRRDTGLEKFCVANAKISRFDENENITDKRRNCSACSVPDNDDGKEPEDGNKEVLVDRCSCSHSKEKLKHQMCDLEPAEHSSGHSPKLQNSVSAHIKKSKESVHAQIKQERDAEADKVATNRSYDLGYFAGKLSEVYRDAGKRLHGTRSIIQNVRVGEIKVVLSQYVTVMSKELPLIRRVQLKPEPEPCTTAENKVSLFDLTRDRVLGLSQNCGVTAIADISALPKGSVFSLRNTDPEVFYQRLVELPPALSQLQSFSPQKIQEKLKSLAPQMQVGKLQSIFWLKTANRKQPVPKAGSLILTEIDLLVLSADSEDTVAVFHHFSLLELKKVQISLAGQHVRLIGCSEDTILAVFTHSKELTQQFCRALLKAIAPVQFSEGTEGHTLLSDDLMVLSLDWTSTVPDIILDCGLHVTCRFKRVLADLLYIVHGNMDGSSKPCLADVCPLLYTSVKVKSSTPVHQDTIFQFLLTDTHVVLLWEDGVFHPVPRGSGLVPVQPQFQGLELRKRSDIRCLLVRQNDNCLVIDIIFTNQKAQTQKKKVELRRASAEVLSTSDYSGQCDSWKLSFGCTSEAVTLINHLCV